MANAIFDGTDAVMLSQETAIGRDPAGVIRMMAAIAEATERELPYWRMLTERGLRGGDVDAVDRLRRGRRGLPARAEGARLPDDDRPHRAAHLLAPARRCPMLALSPRPEVVRRCSLYWGVRGELHEEPEDTLDLLETCARRGAAARPREPGDRIGITAGCRAGERAAPTCSRCTRST